MIILKEIINRKVNKMENNKELKSALQNGQLFDYIANNGWRLTRDELVEIIKEYSWVVYQRVGENNLKTIETIVADNLFDC